ncbi:MFS transporter [Allostreptomyces psammosilenae]|uniref:MFS family permease n=1 Tax=Allostreptomyces psammosilenae TaxID=1892865 RepID=A0A852ZZM5_9ACTN|nr:MFS transporter [Allostreptomyces psammosilenae]NYI07599.1 MFS family permease [Allostreptomyces psammosilenae]
MMDTRPLRIRPFRRLWTSSIITAVGSTFTAVAVPLQIYDITGSSAYVGLSGAVALGPLVVFALWGGALADAVDRRLMLLVTNVGIALVSLLLWAQAAAGLDSVAVLLALVGAQQAFFGANSPARGASTPRLVPADQLTAAVALETTVRWLGAIVGPLIAGILLPLIGVEMLYLVDAVALCAVVWAVAKLPPLPPLPATGGGAVTGADADGSAAGAGGVVGVGGAGEARGAGGARRRVGPRQIVAGFGYLATQRVLLVALLADLIAMLFSLPRALFPEVARETFGDPPGGGLALGLLHAAIPAGAVLSGLLSGAYTRVRRHGVMVTLGVCGWGVAVVGFGLARSLWIAVAFLVFGGIAEFVLTTFRTAILQASSTDDMRGRMQGAMHVVGAGGPWLADIAHGTAGAAVGTVWAISGGGALTVLAMALTAAVFRDFWRYRAPAPDVHGATGQGAAGQGTAGHGSTPTPGKRKGERS